ncbi:MAG: methyltransferase domain-containing protein [Hyphomicrobiaceae bacterium]
MHSNEAYWKAKSGRDYQHTQQERSHQGLSSYQQQMAWLKDYLTSRLDMRKGNLRLLDFGCGFGRVAQLCEEVGGIDYYGYDFSNTMVDGFKDNPPASLANKLDERLRIGDRVSQCFAGETFDVILTISVLIHNDDAATRAILMEMPGLLADEGEIVLIENKLVRDTRFSNLWHGGCWAHDFAGYVDGQLATRIDSGTLSTHAIYHLSRLYSDQPHLSVLHNGADVTYDTLEQLHADAPLAYVEPEPTIGQDLGLAVARLHDANERLAEEAEKRKQLEKQLNQAQGKLERLEGQFALGVRIRASLLEPDTKRGEKKPKRRVTKEAFKAHAEPPHIFDAERDIRYAHAEHPAFAEVLTVFTQEWVGIRAASGSFPGPKLAVSKYHEWSASAAMPIFDRISALGTKKILAQGLSPGLASFLVALRAAMPELKIYGVWHGALAAWCHEEERMLANRFLSMASIGVYDRIHFLKRGMHLLHDKAFAPLLPNPVPRIEHRRLQQAFERRPLTCLFGSWNNAWKNMYANLLGAAASESVGKVISYAPIEYDGPGHKKMASSSFSSRENHLALCSTCDLVLNATIVDCHPMLELEGLAVGTPSLRSNLDLDFGGNHPYERLLTLDSPHNAAEIKARIDKLSGIDPAELADALADYRNLVNETSFQRYGEFLEG